MSDILSQEGLSDESNPSSSSGCIVVKVPPGCNSFDAEFSLLESTLTDKDDVAGRDKPIEYTISCSEKVDENSSGGRIMSLCSKTNKPINESISLTLASTNITLPLKPSNCNDENSTLSSSNLKGNDAINTSSIGLDGCPVIVGINNPNFGLESKISSLYCPLYEEEMQLGRPNEIIRPTGSSPEIFNTIENDYKEYVVLGLESSHSVSENTFASIASDVLENDSSTSGKPSIFNLEPITEVPEKRLISNDKLIVNEMKRDNSEMVDINKDILDNCSALSTLSEKFNVKGDLEKIIIGQKDGDDKKSNCLSNVEMDLPLSNCASDTKKDTANNEILVSKEKTEDLSKKEEHIFSSTPNVTKGENFDKPLDFGSVTPLNQTCPKTRKNLKRKNLGLECIEELDEDDINSEKKIKTDDLNKTISGNLSQGSCKDDLQMDSSLPYFEPPAKSFLKKWQPSCLSRVSTSSSMVTLDECGESDLEETSKCIRSENELATADDFEVAYKSLTEELMKSSSNIESLEKYHLQVQLESQLDDEKFDEVLQELTMNYECDDKTLKKDEQNVLAEEERMISLENKVSSIPVEDSTKKNVENTLLQGDSERNMTEVKNQEQPSDGNIKEALSVSETIGNNNCGIANNKTTRTVVLKIKGDEMKYNEEKPGSSCDTDRHLDNPDKTIIYADGKDMTMDEEDYLLEEDNSSKKKPYVFFEFVSSDPQENEDNYNPEWQKLGQLTSDEERYKAVRDRWRSLVPPDPNRDLTHRQWRARNNKPPLSYPSYNNNHQMHSNERNQLCTAVFDKKIQNIIKELEKSRMKIMFERTKAFTKLSTAQDMKYQMRVRNGCSLQEANRIHDYHLEECRNLKRQYDQELKRITDICEQKIRILKDASEEVLLFQKFYRGVGTTSDEEVCLYMTDIQVQELMETEEMLERYSTFYQE